MPLNLPLLNLQLGARSITLLVIYKPRLDLNISKANQLESTFVEIVNHKKSYGVICCLYKHPNMDILDFENNYLSHIFEIVYKE